MYHIGQFRRPQLNSYSIPLSLELDRQQLKNTMGGGISFYNPCGNLSGDNIINSQNYYYLRFGVQRRSDTEQIFYLKLRNLSETEDEFPPAEELPQVTTEPSDFNAAKAP